MTYRDPYSDRVTNPDPSDAGWSRGGIVGGYSGHSSCGGHHCLRDQQDLDRHGNRPEHDDIGAQHDRPRRRGTGWCSRWDSAIGSDGISVTGRESARSFLIVTAGAFLSCSRRVA